jgi:four helix bundle protein
MFNFEKLRVYNEALELVDSIYKTVKQWPEDERFGLTDQIRRAASSVVLNIAEGSSRTKKDFCHFLDLSRGSCYECVAILKIASKRQYLTIQQYNTLYNAFNQLALKINALKKALINR